MLRTFGIRIPVCDKPLHCPVCGGSWQVQKSVPHFVRTIAQGYFKAQETVHVCTNRCRYDSGKLVTSRPALLAKHLIPGMGIGYDVMTFVGLQRFLHHRQREEIRWSLLHEHGISVSSGTISNLAKLFLEYLRELHNSRSDQLQDAIDIIPIFHNLLI